VAPAVGTIYLVCTSAGEVGIDISADQMVCDLSTFDSMAQRLGRVNRYGLRHDTRIDVVCPAGFHDKDELAPALQATLTLMEQLRGDASPQALSNLRHRPDLPCSIDSAFAPEPTILPATAWTLTTIRGLLPGRPPVEPYLHGIAEWEPPETFVAWRREVEIITGNLLEEYPPADLLDDYPLLSHELLRDRSDRSSSWSL
jgi:CRISPR-associated endonuclease/helicase Cas3